MKVIPETLYLISTFLLLHIYYFLAKHILKCLEAGQPNSAKVTYIVSLREEREIRNGAQQDTMKSYSWLHATNRTNPLQKLHKKTT
jgi:hypothetical protein